MYVRPAQATEGKGLHVRSLLARYMSGIFAPARLAGVRVMPRVLGETMTENERRAQDVFRMDDVILRGALALGLIAMFLLTLLAVQP